MQLETAKELKRVADEFGVKQHLGYRDVYVGDKTIAELYTTDKLLEWLGSYRLESIQLHIPNADVDNYYACLLGTNFEAEADTPSEALAILSIELIKNKIIK